jgi:16S rRNA (cytosine967-C5)-methyltransferase
MRVTGSLIIHQHPLLRSGRITLQDESQMLVGRLWPEGETGGWVLDVCSAPGTKAAHIAEQDSAARVVAGDLTYRRLRRVRETSTRLGLETLLPVVADGTRSPFRAVFRRVLLDAPCTGLGVLRRRPDARWLRSPGEIAAAARVQTQLLDAAAPLLLPGGHLLYSVCTLEPEETQQQVEGFLERHGNFRRSALPAWLPEELLAGASELQILPGRLGMEGLYAVLMQRVPEQA